MGWVFPLQANTASVTQLKIAGSTTSMVNVVMPKATTRFKIKWKKKTRVKIKHVSKQCNDSEQNKNILLHLTVTSNFNHSNCTIIASIYWYTLGDKQRFPIGLLPMKLNRVRFIGAFKTLKTCVYKTCGHVRHKQNLVYRL